MEELSTANGGFAIDFFKQVCKAESNKNILFSPWSISSVMAKLYLGAKGRTAEQIAEVLHFSKAGRSGPAHAMRQTRVYSKMEELLNNPCIAIRKDVIWEYRSSSEINAPPETSSNIHSRFLELSQEINKTTKNFLLRSVNQLYVDKSVPIQKEFILLMKKYYNAEPQAVNFQEAAEEARKEINIWVEHQTEGKIQNLLDEESINSLTQLILVNALYFRGKWAKTFKKKDTTEQPFRLNKQTSKKVKMMFQHDNFNWNYIKEVKTQILELQYANNDFSMFILLPDENTDDTTGLEMLEKKLTYEALSKWTSPEQMEETEADVYLPRIQLEAHYELKAALTSMGITDAFTVGQANFTGMSEKSNLILSQIFHKCFVDINEEGTEAAASTGATMDGRSPAGGILFAADRPFLFFIRHNETKTILFLGRFCSP